MKYVVIQDCWRWARVDDSGKVVEFSDAAYPTHELTLQDLEQSKDRAAHKDVEVEIRHNPQASV